jgi:hypothetical protein
MVRWETEECTGMLVIGAAGLGWRFRLVTKDRVRVKVFQGADAQSRRGNSAVDD